LPHLTSVFPAWSTFAILQGPGAQEQIAAHAMEVITEFWG